MGTTYNITTCSVKGITIDKSSIDSILRAINLDLSTYIQESTISRFNSSGTDQFKLSPTHFAVNLKRSMEVFDLSRGYFDVTIMPLVNFWGFGYTTKEAVTRLDSLDVDSILTFVGSSKLLYQKGLSIQKTNSRQQLDFSAIAKGYAVDVLSESIMHQGVEDFLVEIGGETRVGGVNSRGEPWTLGVSKPKIEANPADFALYLAIKDGSVASSGNYRNYYKTESGIYGHTISPLTGYPFQDSLLAVTVISDLCINADAYATACMAMGYEKAYSFIEELPQTEACFFIGQTEDRIITKFTNGFIHYVRN